MTKDESRNLLMQLLKERGLTQEQFARMADVSLRTAASWCRGTQVPHFAPWEFFALAKRMGVPPQKLAEAMKDAYQIGQLRAEEDKGDRP